MPMPSDLRTAPQTREMPAAVRFLPAEDGAEAGTDLVELAFASAAPVERWWGIEELDMSPGAVRLDRLANAGPLLLDHHATVGAQVGVVKSVRLDPDGIARARVRFSRRPEAQAIAQDVRDGILGKISVGYRVHRAELVGERDGVEVYRIVDWEPLEISIVAVPADDSVGIGRAAQSLPAAPAASIPVKETAMPAEHIEQPAESVRSAETGAANRDAININELATYAHKRAPELKINEIGADFVAFGKPFEEFRALVWGMLTERQAKAPAVSAPASIGMDSGEVERYSLFRAIRAAASGDWREAGLERAASAAVAEQLGRAPRGFFVPMEVQRTLTTGGTGTGAELVGTDHMGNLFIDALRTRSVVIGSGATMLTGLRGNVDIPRLAGSATFYWLAEGGTVTASDPPTGVLALGPKTIAGGVQMTRRLLMQSDPSVETMVRNDLVRGAALAIDLAAIEGTGLSNQPTGIVATSGVNTVTVTAAGAPTWAECVEFETEVDTDDALMGTLAYVTTPAVVGHLKTEPKDAGSGRFLLEGGDLNGYPVRRRTGLTAGRIVFGNFADLVVAMWGVLDVRPDTATLAASDGLVLRVFQDVDIGLRHVQSFAVDA